MKDIQTCLPEDWLYSALLGQGAFGLVRKCTRDKQGKRATSNSTNEDSEGKHEHAGKLSAVKLQSKFQLIRGKQEPHLYNEISIMSKLDHPFILGLEAVA